MSPDNPQPTNAEPTGRPAPASAPGPGEGTSCLEPGDRVGEYVLETPIGEGGCGTVWRAHHAVLPGVIVAVKLPRDPDLIEVLRRESLLQHGLDHPGVLKILGVDLDHDVPYLVQEYAPGGDLAAVLRDTHGLPARRALSLFYDLVEILAHAHAKGVVHRDLKPGNILLDEKGRVRVADFGLGKGLEAVTASALRESIQSLGPYTGQGYVGGTWEYMAPEQKSRAVDDRTAASDARVDVFALGIILFEMLTGHRPAGRVSLEHLSPRVDAIFARCWTSRDRRYRDAHALLEDLRRLRAREPLASETEPAGRNRSTVEPAERARRVSVLRRFVVTYLFPLALVFGGLSLVWFHERETETQFGTGLPGDTRGVPIHVPVVSPDDADRLGQIRRRVLEAPLMLDDVRRLLREYRVTADDATLIEKARDWEKALDASEEAADYEVCWKRYEIQPDAWRRTCRASLEPGRPDVYVRVYRVRDGKETRVFDTGSRPREAWSCDWSRFPETPSFRVNWKRGDTLRVEIWESDLFADNHITTFVFDGDLALAKLSSARRSQEGHEIEFSSDFSFGK